MSFTLSHLFLRSVKREHDNDPRANSATAEREKTSFETLAEIAALRLLRSCGLFVFFLQLTPREERKGKKAFSTRDVGTFDEPFFEIRTCVYFLPYA